MAAAFNFKRTVEVLLSYGFNINLRNSSGATALHFAAHNGCLSIVEYLISHGADVNAVDNNGRSVLDYATGEEEVILTLVQHGANIKNCSPSDKTWKVCCNLLGINYQIHPIYDLFHIISIAVLALILNIAFFWSLRDILVFFFRIHKIEFDVKY